METKKLAIVLLIMSCVILSCGKSSAPVVPEAAEPPAITRTLRTTLSPSGKFEDLLTVQNTWDGINDCIQLVDFSDGRSVVELCDAACQNTALPKTNVKAWFVINSVGQLTDPNAGVAVGALDTTKNPPEVENLCTESFTSICTITLLNKTTFSGYGLNKN